MFNKVYKTCGVMSAPTAHPRCFFAGSLRLVRSVECHTFHIQIVIANIKDLNPRNPDLILLAFSLSSQMG